MPFVRYEALSRAEAPLCSICIANYNGVGILADCLDSVLAQKGSAPIEIIIHDDASIDDSVAWIRQRYPQVELLASSENVGFCISNNRMVEHARGRYILLLNNDAALYPDALETLLAEASSMPRPGILTLPQYDWQSGNLVDRGYWLDMFYNPVPNLDLSRTDVGMVVGACLFLPRALWNELGGFPAWIGSFAEDMYICCLARMRGFTVRPIPASGFRHRQGASFGGNRIDSGKLLTKFRRRQLSERNKTAVMVVCTPTILMWPLLGAHLAMLMLEGAVLTWLRRDPRIWREIYWPTLAATLGGMTTLRARRRQQQAQRRISLREYLRPFTTLPQKLRLLVRHGVPTIR